ncbi:MAG: DUF6117 family protein [Blastomonas fulva]|uniref:DUF6117 family protein n=2 Tax=Alphaproteobacteria TaxID=28211 RepID=UPI004034CB43
MRAVTTASRSHTMAIPKHVRSNFDTLVRAARAGDLALMECTAADSGEPRYVLCAAGCTHSAFVMTPFGHLASGNPYEAYIPSPDPFNGHHLQS